MYTSGGKLDRVALVYVPGERMVHPPTTVFVPGPGTTEGNWCGGTGTGMVLQVFVNGGTGATTSCAGNVQPGPSATTFPSFTVTVSAGLKFQPPALNTGPVIVLSPPELSVIDAVLGSFVMTAQPKTPAPNP